MTQEQILKKAIEKAVQNGWDMFGLRNKDGDDTFWKVYFPTLIIHTRDDDGDIIDAENFRLEEIIYNHDFAKAFWKDTKDWPSKILYPYIQGYEWEFDDPIWKAHLMRMVLEEDTISYLEKFI